MKKKPKKVIVFGTFDVLHEGHRDLFRQARVFGDHLTVVIARDQTVEKIKGRKPRNNECLRYWMVLREELVDEVILGSIGDKYAVLEKVRPEILCIGYDQINFVKSLGSELVKRGFGNVQIKKLEAYYPEKYKSSKMESDEHVVTRAKQYVREMMMQKNSLIKPIQRDYISKQIQKKLLSLECIQNVQTLALFLSVKNEIQTRECIKKIKNEGKTVLVPKLVDEGYMKMCLLSDERDLVKNSLGFFEPRKDVFHEGKIDICIMPCVACDEKGNRLGRGMGYYDKFLSMHACAYTIVLASEEQIISCIPTEKFDKSVDMIITEKRIIKV